MPVTIIPFGGSINNNDRMMGLTSRENGIGRHLVNNVHVGLLGIDGVKAIGQNSMSTDLTQKDSSMLDREDMRRLKSEIELCEADMVLVAMGLAKANEVGNYLRQNLPEHILNSKLIVITGSHDLFSDHPGDARFNLGYAQGHRFSSERGVRVAIHSELFKPEEIAIQFEPRSVFFLNDASEDSFSPMNPNTLIIGMGGTIEGQELSVQQKFKAGFCEGYIKEKIKPKQLPNFFNLAVSHDSRQLTERHVASLKAIIRDTKQTEIVVTVGTFGAEAVGSRILQDQQLMQTLRNEGKRVVFAVAMELPTEQHSDAFYNLGFALAAVRHIEAGVYLSVHGLISEVGAMTKNPAGRGKVGPYFAPKSDR